MGRRDDSVRAQGCCGESIMWQRGDSQMVLWIITSDLRILKRYQSKLPCGTSDSPSRVDTWQMSSKNNERWGWTSTSTFHHPTLSLDCKWLNKCGPLKGEAHLPQHCLCDVFPSLFISWSVIESKKSTRTFLHLRCLSHLIPFGRLIKEGICSIYSNKKKIELQAQASSLWGLDQYQHTRLFFCCIRKPIFIKTKMLKKWKQICKCEPRLWRRAQYLLLFISLRWN